MLSLVLQSISYRCLLFIFIVYNFCFFSFLCIHFEVTRKIMIPFAVLVLFTYFVSSFFIAYLYCLQFLFVYNFVCLHFCLFTCFCLHFQATRPSWRTPWPASGTSGTGSSTLRPVTSPTTWSVICQADHSGSWGACQAVIQAVRELVRQLGIQFSDY